VINILLKFCYAVEIGAYLAYVGHYKVTSDKQVKLISKDELGHMVQLQRIMTQRNTNPSFLFNVIFYVLGKCIQKTCLITPRFLLNKVAKVMELFNIFSYSRMAKLLPEYSSVFQEMELNETQHSNYFT
jgi:demethoxyubiquinone hydroxylase (CLK1/Coq7/Cat5 family)